MIEEIKNPGAGDTAREGDNRVLPLTDSTTPPTENTQVEPPKPPQIQILETVTKFISRPLTVIDGHAYALVALPVSHNGTKKTLVAALRDDGKLWTITRERLEGTDGTLSSLGLENATQGIPLREGISPAGVIAYRNGEIPDPREVFETVVGIIGIFVDFNRSIADQKTMCELLACWIIGTYFLPAFNIAGYLFFTGASGSGKTYASGLGRLAVSSGVLRMPCCG